MSLWVSLHYLLSIYPPLLSVSLKTRLKWNLCAAVTAQNTIENNYHVTGTKHVCTSAQCISNGKKSVTSHKQGTAGFPKRKLPRTFANSSVSVTAFCAEGEWRLREIWNPRVYMVFFFCAVSRGHNETLVQKWKLVAVGKSFPGSPHLWKSRVARASGWDLQNVENLVGSKQMISCMCFSRWIIINHTHRCVDYVHQWYMFIRSLHFVFLKVAYHPSILHSVIMFLNCVRKLHSSRLCRTTGCFFSNNFLLGTVDGWDPFYFGVNMNHPLKPHTAARKLYFLLHCQNRSRTIYRGLEKNSIICFVNSKITFVCMD